MSASLSAPAVQRCIEATLACHGACEETITQCVRAGAPASEQDLIQKLMDCSEITRLCADMLRRRSSLSVDVATLCAQVCDSTAELCAEVGDMEHCMTLCRNAAEVCRELSTTAAA